MVGQFSQRAPVDIRKVWAKVFVLVFFMSLDLRIARLVTELFRLVNGLASIKLIIPMFFSPCRVSRLYQRRSHSLRVVGEYVYSDGLGLIDLRQLNSRYLMLNTKYRETLKMRRNEKNGAVGQDTFIKCIMRSPMAHSKHAIGRIKRHVGTLIHPTLV